MSNPIAFVEELADVTIHDHGVVIAARSGQETFGFMARLALWREFLARETARLNAYDAEQRRRVVPFRKRKGEH